MHIKKHQQALGIQWGLCLAQRFLYLCKLEPEACSMAWWPKATVGQKQNIRKIRTMSTEVHLAYQHQGEGEVKLLERIMHPWPGGGGGGGGSHIIVGGDADIVLMALTAAGLASQQPVIYVMSDVRAPPLLQVSARGQYTL